MSEEHSHCTHSHSFDLSKANNRSFMIGIALNILFVIIELGVGFLNGSMALLTAAGHNASDVASLVLSLLAIRLAKRRPTKTHTYGYKKTTILAALVNA